MRSFKRKLVATGVVLPILAASVLAHNGATGIVLARMNYMSEVAKAMKIMTPYIKGQASYQREEVKRAARKVQAHSGEAFLVLFPKGSMSPASESSEKIWTEWEEFTLLSKQLQFYARGLELAADNPPGSAPGASADVWTFETMATMPVNVVYDKMVTTCTACHKEFRVKK